MKAHTLLAAAIPFSSLFIIWHAQVMLKDVHPCHCPLCVTTECVSQHFPTFPNTSIASPEGNWLWKQPRPMLLLCCNSTKSDYIKTQQPTAALEWDLPTTLGSFCRLSGIRGSLVLILLNRPHRIRFAFLLWEELEQLGTMPWKSKIYSINQDTQSRHDFTRS